MAYTDVLYEQRTQEIKNNWLGTSGVYESEAKHSYIYGMVAFEMASEHLFHIFAINNRKKTPRNASNKLRKQ